MSAIARRRSIPVQIGSVTVGGHAPIVVQSMTNTDTADIEGTAQQIKAQWGSLTALIERAGGFQYARERAATLAAESRALLARERAGAARRALDAAIDYAIQRDH